MKWGLKDGISTDADSGPPRYVLWCCGGICHQPDTFIKIGCGHTVCKDLLKEEFLDWIKFLPNDLETKYNSISMQSNPRFAPEAAPKVPAL